MCGQHLVVIGRERKNGRTHPKLAGSTWDGSMFKIKRHKKCMRVQLGPLDTGEEVDEAVGVQ